MHLFSNARIDLMREVNKHPVLCTQLQALGIDAEWAEQIGEIAAYVNVAMDGMYTHTDLDLVYYPDLQRRLENKRSIIIT